MQKRTQATLGQKMTKKRTLLNIKRLSTMWFSWQSLGGGGVRVKFLLNGIKSVLSIFFVICKYTENLYIYIRTYIYFLRNCHQHSYEFQISCQVGGLG